MNEIELSQALEEIRSKMTLFDAIVHMDLVDQEFRYYLNENQVTIVRELFDLFRRLNFQIRLNSYRKLEIEQSPKIDLRECGTPVKIRPVKKEYGQKTFFGILIGDIPLEITPQIDREGNLKICRSFYNPAIFVPELNQVIFGAESWWGRIESEAELEDMITDEDIQNVWYVKILKAMSKSTDQP